MARSTPIFILSLLLLATVSNACHTCTLPSPSPPPAACPRDTLKLGACVDLLGGVVSVVVGTPASSPCCALLEGLADLDVALCLCTAIKANVLGINLNIPIALSAIVSACGKSIPPGFKCE
ncbi:hypothetical protein ACJRO7_015504 [Eucalyptus globulus]|uniref:Bifunctional inhibitor/plant lipid transfer protein/seed storage helical domain-containing protein n=1 Tax=Eucalyptus globulus TaxID=34317 RepID=A0ABD3L4S1_EUCGL